MWLVLTTDTCAEPNGPIEALGTSWQQKWAYRSTPEGAGEKHTTEQPGSQQPEALALRNQRDRTDTRPPALLWKDG